jgi:hypothetical protein
MKLWHAKKNCAKAWQIKKFNIDQNSMWNMNQRNNSLLCAWGGQFHYYKWHAKKYKMQLIEKKC